MYMPSQKKGRKGVLTVMIRQAKELPAMNASGLANAAVKCYLLPNKSSGGKRKTQVIKNNLNPVWEEQFTYEAGHEELSKERVLEVSIWERDKHGNDFIGGLRLGPAPRHEGGKHKEWMDSIGVELTHWEEMLAHPGEWVEHWHTLRSTMDPRSVDLSSIPPPTAHHGSPGHTHHLPAAREPETARSHEVSQPSFGDEFRKVSARSHDSSQKEWPLTVEPQVQSSGGTEREEILELHATELDNGGKASSRSPKHDFPGTKMAVPVTVVSASSSQESLGSREDLTTPQQVSIVKNGSLL